MLLKFLSNFYDLDNVVDPFVFNYIFFSLISYRIYFQVMEIYKSDQDRFKKFFFLEIGLAMPKVNKIDKLFTTCPLLHLHILRQ